MYAHKLTSYCVQFSITRDLNMQARKKDRFWTFYKWYIWPTSLRHELSIQLYTFILIHALRSFRLVKCLIILLQMYVISDYEVIYIFSSFFHGRGLDERQKIRCRREMYGVIYMCCQFVSREAGLHKTGTSLTSATCYSIQSAVSNLFLTPFLECFVKKCAILFKWGNWMYVKETF